MLAQPLGIEFKPYNVSHFSQARELFKTIWGANRSVEYDAKHWNQTLTGNCPAVIALSEGQLTGFYMVWPLPITDGKEEIVGGQPIDSMVHPDFQGKGLLRELGCRCYDLCQQLNMGVMFGAPNRAAYSGNVGQLNWCHVTNITNWVRPLFPKFGQPRWTEDDDLLYYRTAANSNLVAVATKKYSDELVNLFSAKPVIPRRWQVRYTRTWMRYRYSSTPEAEYFFLTLRRGEATRAAAICGLRKNGPQVRATLAEIISSDKYYRAALLNIVASFANLKGARFLVAKTVTSDRQERLHANGFVPYRRTPLISRTLGWRCYSANAFSASGWELTGGAFDIM
jgi:GNAT superfamily N-acetyltransferase